MNLLIAADTNLAKLGRDRGLWLSGMVLLELHNISSLGGGQLQAHFNDHSLNFVAA